MEKSVVKRSEFEWKKICVIKVLIFDEVGKRLWRIHIKKTVERPDGRKSLAKSWTTMKKRSHTNTDFVFKMDANDHRLKTGKKKSAAAAVQPRGDCSIKWRTHSRVFFAEDVFFSHTAAGALDCVGSAEWLGSWSSGRKWMETCGDQGKES